MFGALLTIKYRKEKKDTKKISKLHLKNNNLLYFKLVLKKSMELTKSCLSLPLKSILMMQKAENKHLMLTYDNGKAITAIAAS